MDKQGEPAFGRTNWKRFAVVVAVPLVAVGFIGVGVAEGAVTAQFTVSGDTFKIKAKQLKGTGFVQYGRLAKNQKDGQFPVVTAGIGDATLTDLCQSVHVKGAKFSLVIRAGRGDKGAHAENLLIDFSELSGDATFKNINIGQDASTLTGAGEGVAGAPGGFGQQSGDVTIDNLEQTTWSTSAGSFTLPGLSLGLKFGDKPEECF